MKLKINIKVIILEKFETDDRNKFEIFFFIINISLKFIIEMSI